METVLSEFQQTKLAEQQAKKRQQEKAEKTVWLGMLENALILEPLVDKPEWFDESQPTHLTEEMLGEVGGAYTGKLIDRFRYLTNHSEIPDEDMNPFRSNNLGMKILTPAGAVFESGVMAGDAKKSAEELFPNRIKEIVSQIKKINEIIQNRKQAGARTRYHRELAKKAMSENDQSRAEEESSRAESIESHTKMRSDEVKVIFALGKLTDYVLRKSMNLPQEYVSDPKRLLAEALKPIDISDLEAYQATLSQK